MARIRCDRRILRPRLIVGVIVAGLLWPASAPAAPDLGVALLDNPDPVDVGKRLTYSLTVANLGPDPATGARASVALSDTVNPLAAKVDAGSCSLGTTTVCNLGDIASGGAVHLSLAVRPTDAGRISAIATAAAAGDAATANNRSSTETEVKLAVGRCANLLVGTPEDEILTGTRAGDRTLGEDGFDEIYGDDGDDCLFGGGDNDILDGGFGSDRLTGGPGADRLLGDRGDDRLSGNAGDDNLRGEDDDDVLKGGAGDDRLRGGGGTNRLAGGAGADRILGGFDRDRVSAGAGPDVIKEAERVDAGPGDDRITADHGAAVRCGPGRDTVRVRSREVDVPDSPSARFFGSADRVRLEPGRVRVSGCERVIRPRTRFVTRRRQGAGSPPGGRERRKRSRRSRCRRRKCCRRRSCQQGGPPAKAPARQGTIVRR